MVLHGHDLVRTWNEAMDFDSLGGCLSHGLWISVGHHGLPSGYVKIAIENGHL